MGEIIYWKEFEKPKRIRLIIGHGAMYDATGEFLCSDERVDLIGFYGGTDGGLQSLMKMYCGILFKNGRRIDFEVDPTLPLEILKDAPNPIELQRDSIISQAEDYLKSLK